MINGLSGHSGFKISNKCVNSAAFPLLNQESAQTCNSWSSEIDVVLRRLVAASARIRWCSSSEVAFAVVVEVASPGIAVKVNQGQLGSILG